MPTREELAEQLRRLANDKTEIPLHRGAMCYEPAMPEIQVMKCDHCGKEFKFSDYDGYNYYEEHMLDKIRNHGCEAYLENWCLECAEREGYISKEEAEEKRQIMQSCDESHCTCDCFGRCMVFHFRLDGEKNYHRALLHNSSDLKPLLAFLENEKSYEGNFGATVPLRDRIQLIKELTGLID